MARGAPQQTTFAFGAGGKIVSLLNLTPAEGDSNAPVLLGRKVLTVFPVALVAPTDFNLE